MLVNVTVVAFVLALAGSFQLFFVHFTHVYHAHVVAFILTVVPYLYVIAFSVFVPLLLTAVIHVHFFNVNVRVSLPNHIVYVLSPFNVGAVLLTVTVLLLGAAAFIHLYVHAVAHVGIL